MREKTDHEEPWTAGESVDGEGEFSMLHQLDLDGMEKHVEKADP